MCRTQPINKGRNFPNKPCPLATMVSGHMVNNNNYIQRFLEQLTSKVNAGRGEHADEQYGHTDAQAPLPRSQGACLTNLDR